MSLLNVDNRLEVDLNTRFSVNSYLIERCLNPDFIMVEFGHDLSPVAYQQPVDFSGKRAYIGVEAWLRDPNSGQNDGFKKLRATVTKGQNIFYITHILGGETRWDERREGSWYVGQYNTMTILPEQISDEVFLSNVFCDPHLADYPERTNALLGEAARLAAQDGIVILRETISPQNIRYIDNNLLEAVGLSVAATVNPDDINIWESLEEIYKGEPSDSVGPEPGSYYLFLSNAGYPLHATRLQS